MSDTRKDTQALPAPVDASWMAKVLDRAAIVADDLGAADTAADRTVAMLFSENSTRTRLSFIRAAELLSCRILDFTQVGSSMAKGESLADTGRTLKALGADCIVVRSSHNDAVADLHEATGLPVISAGEGVRTHPTQALLDLAVLRAEFGRLDGRRVVVAGDIMRSRVARSLIPALGAFGIRVTATGPEGFVPSDVSLWADGVTTAPDLDAAGLGDVDAVYTLRVQHERATGDLSVDDYAERWGMDARRAATLPAHAIIMHPGPVNRGVELASDVMDGPRSRVWQQVARGVPIRMAVLEDALRSS